MPRSKESEFQPNDQGEVFDPVTGEVRDINELVNKIPPETGLNPGKIERLLGNNTCLCESGPLVKLLRAINDQSGIGQGNKNSRVTRNNPPELTPVEWAIKTSISPGAVARINQHGGIPDEGTGSRSGRRAIDTLRRNNGQEPHTLKKRRERNRALFRKRS